MGIRLSQQIDNTSYKEVDLGHGGTPNSAMRPLLRTRNNIIWYLLANFSFFVLVVVINAFFDRKGHNPTLYMVILFALCSTPLLFLGEINGKYCILIVSMPILFVFYGLNDLLTFFVRYHSYWYGTYGSMITTGEVAILVGLSVFIAGYFSATHMLQRLHFRVLVCDWNYQSVFVVGIICIFIGLWATWTGRLISDRAWSTGELAPVKAMMLVGGRMLEPFGTVLLSYAYLSRRNLLVLLMLISLFAVKIPMGLILDSKEIAISSLMIFIITIWLVEGRIPIRWIAITILIILITFPVFYSFRDVVFGQKSLSREKASKALSGNIAAAREKVERAKGGAFEKGTEAFATRVDLKSLTELIVNKVGKDVPYQDGHTFTPLLYVAIPRVIMPNKPDVPVGQLFNRAFHISTSPDTYISTSFLGEFYWNFGWPGVLFGMYSIGLSLGLIGTLCNSRDAKSATRILILVIALYTITLRYETGVAQQYILLLRSLAVIVVMHFVFRGIRSIQRT